VFYEFTVHDLELQSSFQIGPVETTVDSVQRPSGLIAYLGATYYF